MKKALFTYSLLACAALQAAGMPEVNPYTPGADEGIVYFLPKTMLEVNIIATRINYQPGELCQYANRYLRQNNVTSQPETHWEIKQIDVRPAGVPDSTKAYVIKLKDKDVASNVELTNDGIVKAINTTYNLPDEKAEYQLETVQPHENARKYMTEEILMAGSTAKMADLTAKEIYNIRESKNLILRGQADTMPKDGASLKLIIEQLSKQEKALAELFTGITSREDKVFTVYVQPKENLKDHVALRFSSRLGVLPANDLAGEPIYISLQNTSPIAAAQPEGDKKKKKIEGAIYNIPGKGKVTATFEGKTVFESEIPVTQFGGTEVLVDGLFNKKINTRVIFNPVTGGIVKIDKD